MRRLKINKIYTSQREKRGDGTLYFYFMATTSEDDTLRKGSGSLNNGRDSKMMLKVLSRENF
jgi:hypothetical protein